MTLEYRAVFASPYSDHISYGAPVAKRSQVPTYAPRSEETYGYLAGVEVREVTPWRHLPERGFYRRAMLSPPPVRVLPTIFGLVMLQVRSAAMVTGDALLDDDGQPWWAPEWPRSDMSRVPRW